MDSSSPSVTWGMNTTMITISSFGDSIMESLNMDMHDLHSALKVGSSEEQFISSFLSSNSSPDLIFTILTISTQDSK